jgi:hypothetical protein
VLRRPIEITALIGQLDRYNDFAEWPMRIAAIGLMCLLTLAASGGAEPETGSVCVAARALDPFRGKSFRRPGKSILTDSKSRSTSAPQSPGRKERALRLQA